MAWRWPCARMPRPRRWTARRAMLAATRPTAINLRWALDRMRARAAQPAAGRARARRLCRGRRDRRRRCRDLPADRRDTACRCSQEVAARKPGEPVNVLTHCNAGWLATVDWGTALAPIYQAHDAGLRACLGGRDPAAQPGRRADRLGAAAARRAAHRHRRQCRRPSDAARRGRSVHRRHRPHHRGTAMSPTRSAPI